MLFLWNLPLCIEYERKGTRIFIFSLSRLSLTYFCNVFWLEMKPQRYFLIFLIFLEFSITHRVGTKRNDNFYFLSFPAFSSIFWLKMKPQWYFFNFLNFFVIFLEFSITPRVRMERKDNFYFLFFSIFSSLFCLEMKL